MKTLAFALVVVMLFCSVAMAEIKVVVCPLFESIGESDHCVPPFVWNHHPEKLREAPSLQQYLDDGWKIINDVALPPDLIGNQPHKITLQR